EQEVAQPKNASSTPGEVDLDLRSSTSVAPHQVAAVVVPPPTSTVGTTVARSMLKAPTAATAGSSSSTTGSSSSAAFLSQNPLPSRTIPQPALIPAMNKTAQFRVASQLELRIKR
ncbi:unnamed protein product, partial [Amoebophrya sp. A120]